MESRASTLHSPGNLFSGEDIDCSLTIQAHLRASFFCRSLAWSDSTSVTLKSMHIMVSSLTSDVSAAAGCYLVSTGVSGESYLQVDEE